MPKKYSFKKNEHLCSKKTIEALFDRKNSANEGFLVYPIRIVFNHELNNNNEDSEILNLESQISKTQVLFSVSKRNFKRAVDRNLIRRRIRESYRLNKLLLAEKNINYLAFIYVAKEICDYNVIEKSMKKILTKI